MYYKHASDLKHNKMPVVWFQFQQLCQILEMSVENIISTQKDLAAICKCRLILKKRLRRLIALSCLFFLRSAESQHSREWQLCERPGIAVLVKTPAFGSDDTAESLLDTVKSYYHSTGDTLSWQSYFMRNWITHDAEVLKHSANYCCVLNREPQPK